MNPLTKQWKILVNRVFPKRQDHVSIDALTDYLLVLRSHLEHMSAGAKFDSLGELPTGKWVETEKGVLTRLLLLPKVIAELPRRVTIMESKALTTTRCRRIHNHNTDDVRSNQIILVEKGEIEAAVYDGPDGNKIYSSVYGPNSFVTFTYDQWHSVKFKKGAEVISIFFPPI